MVAKSSLIILVKYFSNKHIWENIDGEMFIRMLQTNLLQIFSKIIRKFQVILKSVEDPDGKFKIDTKAWMG